MTRRDQTLRAWIERDHPRECWTSCVSYQGKVSRRITHTRIRKAALEYNPLHVLTLLRPETIVTPAHQPDLFSDH